MNQRKDRYERLMLRDDEEGKGPSCRTKGHIEVNMHSGRGNFLLQYLEPML